MSDMKQLTLLANAARAWNNEDEPGLDAAMEEIEVFLLEHRTQPEATAPAQDLSAAILALPCKANMADLRGNSDTELRAYQEGHKDARLAASALISGNSFREHLRRSSETVKNWPDWKTHMWAVMPSDALSAGDRVDAERYRYIRDTATLDNAVWEALEGYGMTNGAGELLEDEYRAGMDRAIDRAIAEQKENQNG